MSGAVVNELEKILKPCPAEEFLASSWGKALRLVRGWPGKFAELLPWSRLNEILRQHRLDHPRLRLVQDGKPVPASSYVRHVSNARRRTPIPRLNTGGLTKHLREGATLVLDAVDELQPPVESLAAGLELVFREHVQVNCYAGWQTSRGFDLHWDDHDVFILQVRGRKRWSVYGMTRPYPLAPDIEAAPKPEHEPLWDGTLEDGDLLYIPRGWWHVAMPLAEPTLHLTVGIHNRTGMDWLRWLTERLRASEPFRRDLPRLASTAERAAHVERLREELLAAVAAAPLESYLEEYDANAQPRARLSLPWSATPGVLPLSNRAVVCFTPPRPLEFKIEAGVVEFSCLRKRWRFAEGALVVLRPLASRRVCSFRELFEAARGTLDEPTVRALIGELILHGLVAIVDE
ncbi:MAG: cupin domain-containing protein [Acidobacteria bacterium]|nr:cupin domain-containing protein [Acidobacteriota bacterium]